MNTARSSRSELWLGCIVLLMLVLFTLLPFVGMLSAALQPAGSNPTGIQVPTNPAWGNFITAFEMSKLPTLMTSSLILVLMVVPVGLVLATAAAYGIVVLRVPFGGVAFVVLLLGLTIPFESLIVPLYHLMKDAGLLNTRLAIAMPLVALYLPFGVFWMRAHFQGVPKEITEAAEMDGAGWWRALWHVHLPLARPALTTLLVLYSLWTWNQFIIALVMMDEPLMRTVAGALGAFQGQYGTDIVLLSAGALLIMLPTITVFAIFQKQFVVALLQGSVKG